MCGEGVVVVWATSDGMLAVCVRSVPGHGGLLVVGWGRVQVAVGLWRRSVLTWRLLGGVPVGR